MKNKILLAVGISLLTGCVGPGGNVPATKFNINPTNGAISVDSPKDITISNLVAELPNGIKWKMEGYVSKNSPDVITSVANANALMADKLTQLADKLGTLAGTMAGEAAKKSVTP